MVYLLSSLIHVIVIMHFISVTLTEHFFKGNSLPYTETCNAVQTNQVISIPGCINKTLNTYFCRGNCKSGFDPNRNNFGDVICKSCWPDAVEKLPVSLLCINGTRIIDVEVFKKCSCKSAHCANLKVPVILKPKKEKPCQLLCRKCRKSRRIYSVLMEQLKIKNTCMKPGCKRLKKKKKAMSKLCKVCNLCIKKKKY